MTTMTTTTIEDATHGRDGARHGTLYVAVEISRKSWVVALQPPDAERVGLHVLPAADADALAALVERTCEDEARRRGLRPRVLCAYEAGYEGFWLARRLTQAGVETLVLDAASLPVARKGRRVKTDRLDATRMVRALAARDRGDPFAVRAVRAPSVEEEDRRRLLRERRRLVKQRTMLVNAIRGLLMLHGIFDLDPRSQRLAEALEAARTGCGAALPPGVRAEIRRTRAILAAVEAQIAEVEAERDRRVARCRSAPDDANDTMIARLSRLRGVGANDAALLAHEVFWRGFRNRRELAGWAGLAAAPCASGGGVRTRGIDKAGPPWVRAQLVQLAWRWLRHQPESAFVAVVSRACRGGAGADAAGARRRPRPQAAGGAVALRDERRGAARGAARLSVRASSTTGPQRPEAGGSRQYGADTAETGGYGATAPFRRDSSHRATR